MIEVTNLTKRYGQNVAVDNVSFHVGEGEILGFLGLNGAGKSTTMNIMTGYLSATEGSCKINGFDVLENPMEAKKAIGYLPEQPPLYLDMTVKDYLDFIYDLKKCKLPRNKHIEDICRTVKIENVYKRLIKNLSKGYKQRVGIAQALIGNPEVLILDEPTSGLDPNQIIEIRNLIKTLGKRHTVIMSSHILSEVEPVCSRILVIHKGRLVADDTTANLSRSLTDDRRYTALIEGPEREVLKTMRAITGMVEAESVGKREDGVYEYRFEAAEDADVRHELFKRLAERSWPLLGLRSNELSLEDIFLRLTNGKELDPLNTRKSAKKAAKPGDKPAMVFDMEKNELAPVAPVAKTSDEPTGDNAASEADTDANTDGGKN